MILIDENELDNNADADEVDNNEDAVEVVNDDDNNNANEIVNNNKNTDGIDNGANQVMENNEEAEEGSDQSALAISIGNSADEIIHPDQATEEAVCRTKSDRISTPYDFVRHFLEIAHYQDVEEEGKLIEPYYFDNNEMEEKMSDGMHYQSSHFSSDTNVEKIDLAVHDEKVKR